jgi:hypothetical protein
MSSFGMSYGGRSMDSLLNFINHPQQKKRPRTKNDQARCIEICFYFPVDHFSGSSSMRSTEGLDIGEYDGHHQKIPSCCPTGKTRS